MATMWSSPQPPPPSASPRTTASSLSANNALFLIAFGMFLVVSVLPALVAALVKLVVLATAVLLIAAATNPTDHSFACWVSSQENIRMRDTSGTSSSVSQWFSAVVKTAIAIVRNEPLVWRVHNVFVFTVVYVPVVERYALGCFGTWRWADANSYVLDLCRAPWVVKVSRGGVESSLEQYLETPASGVSSSRRSGVSSVRQRHTTTAAPASMPSAFADVLHAAGLSNVVASAQSSAPVSSGLSDRELRTRAMQLKIKRDWKDAAQAFLAAASVALSTLSKTNYRLEAAWCLLEDSDTYPDRTTQLIKMVEQVCEELVTSGYFDEASRAFAELALRLKRKFPQDLHREAFARDLALLFVQAKNAAEAGGSVRGAVENGLRAAAVYVDVGLWALAEECFETAGEMARSLDSSSTQATEALGNAVLCRIGQLDVGGAEEMLAKHARQSSSASDMDVLLASVLKAYGKWSLQILDTACKRYDATRRLTTWQWECLNNLRDKMTSTDLRRRHIATRGSTLAAVVHGAAMTHELKRPLLFNVLPTKTPLIGVVNQSELSKLEQRRRERRNSSDDSSSATDCDAPRSPGPGSPRVSSTSVALPLVRSPRPEKPTYIPSPSKTPQYFRWKRPPAPGQKTPSKPTALRPGPSASSPRASPWRDSSSSESTRPPSLVAMPSGRSLRLTEPSERDAFDLEATSRGDMAMRDSAPSTPLRQPSLFQYSDPLTAPTTPKSPHTMSMLNSDAFATATVGIRSLIQVSSQDAQTSGALFETPARAPTGAQSELNTAAPATAAGLAALSGRAVPSSPGTTNQHSLSTPSPFLTVSSLASTGAQATTSSRAESELRDASAPEAPPARERTPSPELDLDTMDETSSSFDALTSTLVLQTTQNRAPQERVITQHVLRGAFLRKYLHVTNITRKLKETEQLLRASALSAGVASRTGTPQRKFSGAPQLAKSPTGRGSALRLGDFSDAEEPGLIDASVPVLRRLSSIDKAINKTVKRIRRLSGMESSAAAEGSQQQSPQQLQAFTPTPAAHMKAKYTSLRAISETPASKQREMPPAATPARRSTRGAPPDALDHDNDEDEDEDDSFGTSMDGVRMDPSSAHMLRICQHVMAKRAIKAFVRQEMSIVHLIEVSLRDDESMQRQRLATPSTSNQSSGASESASVRDSRYLAVKAMSADIVDAVAAYLTQGDQHMTVDELYLAARDAEAKKLWKRAILLTSACIVIDREFLQVVLLRARCCRRIGLWTQAIKDLGHAVLLRPDEPRLCLLRAFLYVKMTDLDNALADVNRALLLHPKSTDALLLRADIFHRQNSTAASLQDLTTVLSLDPSCWRAYYDRATIRIRAVEGDEQCLSYHWEHMKYEELLVSIIEDYINALRKGCKMVEVVETIGDLTVRLMEFTGDKSVLRQVVQSLAHLVQILSTDHRGSFHLASAKPHHAPSSLLLERTGDAPLTTMERELLVAALHAQRGRLFVLFGDKASALVEFDHAVVSEYHYPVAHFYRGAFATLVSKDNDSSSSSDAAKSSNVQHLTRSIALDPTIAGAYTVRGALYLRDLKFNSALQDFKAAVTTDPTLYEVWLQIALIYLNHYHDCDACIRACTSALTNDSCLSRALYLRAEAYTRQGNTAAALRDYGRLTVAAPDDRWTHLLRGRLLLQLKHARPALYSFILFMEQGSAGGDKRAHVLCGMAFKILTRFQRAVAEFQRAVALSPTSENLVLLSESLHSLGDTENSLRVSEKVISADPGSYKGYVRRAQLFVSVGQFQLAMSEYDKALFLAPKEGRVYYERGIVQMQLYLRWRMACLLNFDRPTAAATATAATGQQQHHVKQRKTSPFDPTLSAIDVEMALGADPMNDEATVRKSMKTFFAGSISDFSKCMRLEPLVADPYVDRAELYALSEDYDKAFHDFDAALERDPKCVRAHVNLGVLKCHFAAFASAIEDFDKAIKLDAKLSLAYFNRGVAYHKLSLWAQAETSYGKCIALRGTGRHTDAHRNRAIARCQLNDFAGALADFEVVQQSAPDDDQLHGGLGYVLLQLGRYEDAAKSFATYGRLSRDTFADSGNAYFNLATQSAVPLDHATHRQYLQTALRFYVRAARIHPSNTDVRLNMANCLRKQREFARAITQCDTIATMKPNHHAALESKAFALYELQQYSAAVECMSAAIRACVASSSSLENIFYAFAHDSIHRHALERKTVTSRDGGSRTAAQSTAVALATPVSQLKPSSHAENAAAPSMTAPASPLNASAESEPPERAVSASEIIVRGSSKQLLSLYMLNRGIMYEKLGLVDLARQNYRDAIHFDALSVHAQLCMGTLDIVEARYSDSIAHFTRALAIEPHAAVAHINIGVAYMLTKDTTRALAHFDTALALAPTCSYAYANKAVALAHSGNVAQAEHHLKRAIEELPSQREYYLARGKIIAQQKRLQDAMVDFSTALFLGYEGKL